MKTKLYCLAILSFLMTNCFAQGKDTTIVSSLTKISFLSPGISYEKRIGKCQSIYARAFMSISAYAAYSSSFGFTSGFSFDPGLAIQYRYYYNAGKRKTKGKRTEINSLNYISPAFETVFSKKNAISSVYFEEYSRRAMNQLGFVWGMQRNYPRHFSLDLNIGPGWFFTKGIVDRGAGLIVSKNTSEFTIMGQFTLGFWLNKRK